MSEERIIKTVKIFGILFLILAVCNIVILASSFAIGDMSVANIMEQGNTTEDIAKICIGVIVVLAVVLIAIDIIMGVKALQQAKGKYEGRLHINLAKVLLVITILGFALSLPDIFKNGITEVQNFLGLIANIMIYSAFIYYTRALNKKSDNLDNQ